MTRTRRRQTSSRIDGKINKTITMKWNSIFFFEWVTQGLSTPNRLIQLSMNQHKAMENVRRKICP